MPRGCTTSTCSPRTTSLPLPGANTTPENNALMNDSGTTTTATMTTSFEALAL